MLAGYAAVRVQQMHKDCQIGRGIRDTLPVEGKVHDAIIRARRQI